MDKIDIIKIQKKALRQHMRQLRAMIDPICKKKWDSQICKAISQTYEFATAQQILLYSAISGEIDLSELFFLSGREGKTIAFPRSNEDNTISFHIVKRLNTLQPGKYQIPEPPKDSEIISFTNSRPTLCVVPGLAYDRLDNRLGAGGGYYDRFFEQNCHEKIIRLGAFYSFQEVDSLPCGPFDVKLHKIITENNLHI